jgi:hypothetical protein
MNQIKFYPFDKTTEIFAPKPVPASKMVPEWYKRQVSAGSNDETIGLGFTSSTIKRCMPIFDLMTSGYFLLAPCDIYIDSSNPNRLEHSDLLRFNPLWSLSTPSGYSTMFINPPFKDSLPIEAVSALIDTDKYISNGHLSFFVKSGFVGVIPQGTPLIQAIPFRREPWGSEFVDGQTASEKIDNQFFKIRSTFTNGYKNKMRTKKEYK